MTQYGIVLGGGGVKGCYEIGVWKALLELEVPNVNTKLYRKLMAIFVPRVCITNIFLSLMIWRSENPSK